MVGRLDLRRCGSPGAVRGAHRGPGRADGLQLAEDVGDVLVVLGEDLLGEGVDGAGDALRSVRPGLLRDVQGGTTWNQHGPFGRRCAEWSHHANDEGPTLADQPVSPSSAG